VDVFYYGLFMDPKTIRSKGFTPTNPRTAFLIDRAIRIGPRATLRRENGSITHGVVMTLPSSQIIKLYDDLDLFGYDPEAVEGVCEDGTIVKAITYNLPADVDLQPDREYLLQLCLVAQRVGLPWHYVRRLLDEASVPPSPSLPSVSDQPVAPA
jgi:hypothetical protein